MKAYFLKLSIDLTFAVLAMLLAFLLGIAFHEVPWLSSATLAVLVGTTAFRYWWARP